ncbi:MAG: hypothetical protein K2P84_08720 [Undibacterium sp.]|nr:hypothetical protein [Undibacterium sp.]
MNVNIKWLVATLFSLFALVACSKNDANKPADAAPSLNDLRKTEPAPAPSLSDIRNPEIMKKEAEKRLPQGDREHALADYKKVDSGHQLMFMYFGISSMPVDYEKIASLYSQEYARTNDAFKRQDILKALMPRIEAEIAGAKTDRYFIFDIQDYGSALGSYDLRTKGFKLNAMKESGGYRYFNDNQSYHLSFTNSMNFALLSEAEEARARVIEAMVSQNQRMKVRIFAFAQDADPSNMTVKAQILKVQIFKGQDELIGEI